MWMQCKKKEKFSQVGRTSHFWNLRFFQMFAGPLFQTNVHHKYCITRWISKLPGSFEIHSVRQFLVNFTGLAGLVNATVCKTEPYTLTVTVLESPFGLLVIFYIQLTNGVEFIISVLSLSLSLWNSRWTALRCMNIPKWQNRSSERNAFIMVTANVFICNCHIVDVL